MKKLALMTKKEKMSLVRNSLQIIMGTLILAIGQVLFIEQCSLVTGGLASIGNIINKFFPSQYTVSITVVVLNILCFLVGSIFIGKTFAAQTLLSAGFYTLLYPAISALMSNNLLPFLQFNEMNDLNLLLAGLFGGVISGIGIGICMAAGGSTGGVDVFAILISKITRIKVSILVFIIDGTIVLLGFIFIKPDFVYFLICVLSSICCSASLEFVFTRKNNCYVIDIISKEWKAINDFIIINLERGSTIVNVQGGYKFEDYRMIQAAISRNQYALLLDKISEIDQSAFVIVSSAREVNGEGFQNLPKKKQLKGGNNDESKK